MSAIEKLVSLLRVDEDGEEIAQMLLEQMVDEKKKQLLLIKLVEAEKEADRFYSPKGLTPAEQAIKDLVLSGMPLSPTEVGEKLGDQIRSLKHRSYASAILNGLVDKGVLGKVKEGNTYYFTSPRDSFKWALSRLGETPQECSPDEISGMTGIPLPIVLEVRASFDD